MARNAVVREVFRYFFRAVILAPIAGWICGCIVLSLEFICIGETLDAASIMTYTLPLGSSTGLLLGLLTFWPLRRMTAFEILLPLLVWSIAGGMLIIAVIPASGPLSCFGGIAGYFLAYAYLLRIRSRRKNACN